MKIAMTLIALCFAVSACSKNEVQSSEAVASLSARESTFTIATDPKGIYVVLEKGGEGNERTILTKREGPSGTTFSKRLYNCAENTVKYLGTGDTMEAMAASPADPTMAPITNSSIAYYLGQKACA